MKNLLLIGLLSWFFYSCQSSERDKGNQSLIPLENHADSIAALIKKETNTAADTFYKASKEAMTKEK